MVRRFLQFSESNARLKSEVKSSHLPSNSSHAVYHQRQGDEHHTKRSKSTSCKHEVLFEIQLRGVSGLLPSLEDSRGTRLSSAPLSPLTAQSFLGTLTTTTVCNPGLHPFHFCQRNRLDVSYLGGLWYVLCVGHWPLNSRQDTGYFNSCENTCSTNSTFSLGY